MVYLKVKLLLVVVSLVHLRLIPNLVTQRLKEYNPVVV